jgi:hypothetical protein
MEKISRNAPPCEKPVRPALRKDISSLPDGLLQDGVSVQSGSFLAQSGNKPGHGERAGVRPANRLPGQTPTRHTMKKSLTAFIILSALALSG